MEFVAAWIMIQSVTLQKSSFEGAPMDDFSF